MAPISSSVCVIQKLLVLLNSARISAYTYDDILYILHITDKKLYILNFQNQVKFKV